MLDENGVQLGTTLSIENATNFENYNFDGTTASLLATGNFGSNSKVFVQFDDPILREVTANPDGMNATGGSITINLEDSSGRVSRSFMDNTFRWNYWRSRTLNRKKRWSSEVSKSGPLW